MSEINLFTSILEEYDLRYRVMQYKKLMKQYTLNRIERNNYFLVEKSLEELLNGDNIFSGDYSNRHIVFYQKK